MNEDDAARWGANHRSRTHARKAKRTQPAADIPCDPTSSRGTFAVSRGVPLAPVPLRDDMVTVSLVAGDAPASHVERSLRSVLEGTHRNIRVVVFEGDDHSLRDAVAREISSDARVTFVDAPPIHGPYFLHDAVLRASDYGLFAIQDPHDVSTSDRFQRQLAALFQSRVDVALSPVIDVDHAGLARITPCTTEVHPLYGHRADHFGVFNGASLLRLGGYFFGFRRGVDTLVTSMLSVLGRVAVTRDALYRRHAPPLDPETAPQESPGDVEDRHLRDLYDQVYRAAQRSALSGLQQFSDIARVRVSPFARDTHALAKQIRHAFVPLTPPAACDALLNGVMRHVPAGLPPISDALARHLYRYCEGCRPQQLLDVGSGIATFVLALYAGRNQGTHVVSVQHDRRRHYIVDEALRRAGLRSLVDLRLCPLRRIEARPRGYVWYDYDLESLFPGGLDFMFVDGPDDDDTPARDGVLLQTQKILRPGTLVWMHDANEAASIDAVHLWRSRRQIEANVVTTHDPRGVWELALR